MPRPPAPLPSSLPDAFSVAQARRAGVSAGRVRARDLDAPFRGVRVRPGDADRGAHPRERAAVAHVALARAYATAMPPDAVFSHQTAALIHGLPVPVPRLLDVSAIAPRRASRAAGVRGRQLDPAFIGTRCVSGLLVCDPATAWAQLGGLVGASLTLDDLVVAGDAIVRIPRLKSGHAGEPRHALARIDDLRAATSVGRRAGAAALRASLDLIRLGSSSAGETSVRLAIVRAELPEPELDVEILGDSGELIGIADLAYRLFRVMVEYEGDRHRVDVRQWNRDIDKYATCESLGWIVVRVTAAQLRSGTAVARIGAALERRGWRPASRDASRRIMPLVPAKNVDPIDRDTRLKSDTAPDRASPDAGCGNTKAVIATRVT